MADKKIMTPEEKALLQAKHRQEEAEARNRSNKQKGTNHLCKSARLKAPPMVGRLQYSQTLQSINRS